MVTQGSKREKQEVEATCYLKTGSRNWHFTLYRSARTLLYFLDETITETAQIQKRIF